MAIGDFFSRLGGRSEEPAPEPEPQRPPTGDALRAALAETERLVADGGVPSPVTARVLRVTGTVRDTIPRLDALGAGSDRAYAVMATATDYLPEAVGGYLRLPRRFADTRPIDGPKTALMVLVDQLDLLGATMDAVFDAVCRDDANALVAHGRFLAEKFGARSSGGDLEVAGLPVPPMPPPSSSSPSSSPETAAEAGPRSPGPAGSGEQLERGDEPGASRSEEPGASRSDEPGTGSGEPDTGWDRPSAGSDQPGAGPEAPNNAAPEPETTGEPASAPEPRIDRLRPPSSLDL